MSLAPPCIKAEDKAAFESRPNIDGRKILRNGQVLPWEGPVQEVFAPIYKVRSERMASVEAVHAVLLS